MPKKDKTTNLYAKMIHKDVVREALSLRQTVTDQKDEIKKLKRALKDANDVLIADIRSRKIKEITDTSDYSVEDLDKFNVEELDGIIQVLSMKKKGYKSVSDTSGPRRGQVDKLQHMFGKGWDTTLVN